MKFTVRVNWQNGEKSELKGRDYQQVLDFLADIYQGAHNESVVEILITREN